MGTPHGDAQSGMTKGAPASNHVPSASKAEEEWPSASATKGLSTSGQAQSAAAREIAELRETCAILETKVGRTQAASALQVVSCL